jgi:hypothetical protein
LPVTEKWTAVCDQFCSKNGNGRSNLRLRPGEQQNVANMTSSPNWELVYLVNIGVSP